MRSPRAALFGVALLVLVALVVASCSDDSNDGSTASDQKPSEVARDNTLTPLLVTQGGPPVRPVRVSDGQHHLLYGVALENAISSR